MRLLLVEDDAVLAGSLGERLRAEGYAVDIATNGIDGEHLGREERYDIVVLDLGLPGRAGLDVLASWRGDKSTLPVLILTARGDWEQKVAGFKAGADDYLTKPFHVEELIARVAALIRRSTGLTGSGLSGYGLELDDDRQELRVGADDPLPLTGMEFRLLRYFMSHPGKVLSKTRLTEAVYELDEDRDSNVIEVYVTRLRRVLPSGLIETRRGQGYVFGAAQRRRV